jgi:IS5 family transposase
VTQLAEVTENTRRGARGLILPAVTAPGNPGENAAAARQRRRNGAARAPPREVALDGAFMLGPTNTSVDDLEPERVFIPARQQPGSRRTQRRLQRYRTGAEGRISHLKRRYGLDRSRLTGADGQQIWSRWSILADDLDTLAVRAG